MGRLFKIQFSILCLFSSCLFSCGDEGTSPLVNEKDIVLSDGDFHTAKQSAYIQSGYNTIAHFADGTEELSKPRPLPLHFEEPDAKHIQVSFNSLFQGDVSQTYEIDGGGFYYLNPLLDTDYYWRVSQSEDFANSKVYSIHTTSSCPRNIDLDGITNVRDMGGYTSSLGGVIRQELVYRGGKLTSGSKQAVSCLTEKGYTTLIDGLGIKSEIDLRYDKPFEGEDGPENGYMSDSFFPTVHYYSCPIDWHSDNLMATAKQAIRDAFKVLSDPENYPVYIHCAIGTDRTGLICYLLGALLGMSNEDLYRDYLFSNFGNIGSNRTDWTPRHVYFETLQRYEGKNLSEKCTGYLKEIGVTQQEINSILCSLLNI